MGLLLGLFFGIGLLLIIATFVAPGDSRPAAEGRLIARSRELLASAGIEGVTPGAFVGACVIIGLVGFLLMFAVSGAWPVGRGVRPDGRWAADRVGAEPGAEAARRVPRAVAGRGGQHRVGGPGRAVAVRGAGSGGRAGAVAVA